MVASRVARSFRAQRIQKLAELLAAACSRHPVHPRAPASTVRSMSEARGAPAPTLGDDFTAELVHTNDDGTDRERVRELHSPIGLIREYIHAR